MGGVVGRRLPLQARVAALLNLGSMPVPTTRFLGSHGLGLVAAALVLPQPVW